MKGLAPKERLFFKPKYWAKLFLNIYIFVLFSYLLLHRLAMRISLPIYSFYKLLFYWSSLQLGDPASQRLSLWSCWYFILAHILIYPLAKVWHIVNFVPSSTGCTGNLNRKDSIVKVRFLTAMRGTSWQSIVDGPHELCELKFASCDRFGPVEGSSS